MGTLTVGATYRYEKIKGVTYATDVATDEIHVVGWDYVESTDTMKEELDE